MAAASSCMSGQARAARGGQEQGGGLAQHRGDPSAQSLHLHPEEQTGEAGVLQAN